MMKSLPQNLEHFYDSLEYLPQEKQSTVKKAYILAFEAHASQKRSSGELYITHPLAVAQILADMRMDSDTICAALLHDVLEDTPVQKALLAKEFGEHIADIVDGVSKLTQIEFSTFAEAQAENFRKMLLAMTHNIRVILVKLADRLHNMRTLGPLPEAKKQRIAQETLEIYAPIANRLGMHSIRIELEDLIFQAVHPMRYRILHDAVFKARGHRQETLHAIRHTIRETLEKHGIPAGSVLGRQKHLYGIYQKMQQKHLSFGEVMDIYGFRIVVDGMDDCYRALGAVHNLYKPVPGKFKDYIAIPKSNGYQSLHTILFGPDGVPIEIQIRTNEMDYYAENGIAAHWLYKTDETRINLVQLKVNQWLKHLIEMQQTSGNSEEFIESVKIDLFPDEVYVFTPKGKILELPGGATPIDFAYAVHSDIGDHCVGVRLNKRHAPLSTRLTNGQTVEILTDSSAAPKAEWLNFVVSGRARNKIKHFIKTKHYDISVSLGRQLLINALLSLGEKNLDFNLRRQQKLLKEYGFDDFDTLLAEIGLGTKPPMEVAQTLLGHLPIHITPLAPLIIKGTESMVVHFSTCCYPVPLDSISGLLVPGEGLHVHRDACPLFNKALSIHGSPIPLCWHTPIHEDFKACLVLDVENKRGVLASLTAAVSEAHVNIYDLHVVRDDGVFSTVRLIVYVSDAHVLGGLIQALHILPSVLKIERLMGEI